MKTLSCALAVVVAFATIASAQYPDLHTRITPPMTAGESAWVHFYWRNDTAQPITQFEVTATLPDGWDVLYPRDRAYTSLNQNNELAVSEVDYCAMRITAPADENNKVTCRANLRFVADGKAYSLSYLFEIPIVHYGGDDMRVVTSALNPFTPGAAQWVHVYFQGLYPQLDNYKVVVSDAGGATIIYPGGRTYSGLYNDSTLSAGEVDYCGLRVDTAGLAVGDYKLQLTITYDKGKKAETEFATVTLKVDDSGLQPAPAATLSSDVQRISPTALKAVFYLNAGKSWAEANYRMIGSLSGTSPGLTLNGKLLPLNIDPYLMFTAWKPNEGPLTKATGKLDTQGRSYANFGISASLAEILVGITVYHAFVLLDKDATVLFTSNWVPLSFVGASGP